MTLFPLQHQFLSTVPEGLVSNLIETLQCGCFFSFLKIMYLSFLLTDLVEVHHKKLFFPKNWSKPYCSGDIATLTMQIRVQLATLHNRGQGSLASVPFIQCTTRAPKSISLLQTLKKNTIKRLFAPLF